MTVLKNLYSLYIYVIRPKRRKNNKIFFHLNKQTLLVVDSIETWDKQARFYFRRYSAMAFHKLSQFSSRVFIFDFTWDFCRLQEAMKFSRINFYKYHRGYSLFMTGVENLFVYWPGSHNLGPGRQSQQILLTGDATGALGQGVFVKRKCLLKWKFLLSNLLKLTSFLWIRISYIIYQVSSLKYVVINLWKDTPCSSN